MNMSARSDYDIVYGRKFQSLTTHVTPYDRHVIVMDIRFGSNIVVRYKARDANDFVTNNDIVFQVFSLGCGNEEIMIPYTNEETVNIEIKMMYVVEHYIKHAIRCHDICESINEYINNNILLTKKKISDEERMELVRMNHIRKNIHKYNGMKDVIVDCIYNYIQLDSFKMHKVKFSIYGEAYIDNIANKSEFECVFNDMKLLDELQIFPMHMDKRVDQ